VTKFPTDATGPAPGAAEHDTGRSAARWILAGIALLLTGALVAAGPVLFELWAKPLQSAREQDRLDSAIEQQWDDPVQPSDGRPADTDEDKLFARLYIPTLDRHWVVLRGVDEADIEHAPGVYPDSQQPSRPGNVAIFGHRRKKLFWDLDKLDGGDLVFLETRTSWLTYRIYDTKTVTPNDTSVVGWNPGKASARPARKLLTLITCTPKLSTTKRLVVQAELADTRSRKAGPPPGVPST
jgi:sortase A